MHSDKLRLNRLSREKSPYLKQHESNPVDWYPWGEEAFNKAKEENKPIFLSIGYSTCHWCHVMEHESFSNPEVASLMNEIFVAIKVDREERPDVDSIYMTVCQMLTGSGGWPMTILMTPDAKPFFAGTYFPTEKRGDRPGIKDIIIRTRDVWNKFRDDITQQSEEITQQLNSVNYKAGNETINNGIFRKAFYELASTYDELNGGFGNRPKFPIPHNLLFLFRYGRLHNSPEAVDMALNTLRFMRQGGIYDHVGYGFHRYSTDAEWKVPHFEKMLYDEALLLLAYTEAYQINGDKIFEDTVDEIIKYLKNELYDGKGALFSAEDADSEGEEGKFYLWEISEIRQVLMGDVEFFCDVFNIRNKGNYFDEVKGTLTGKNILHRTKSIEQIATEYSITNSEVEERLNNSLRKLYDIRKKRIRPSLDNKVLTDWNSLAAYSLTKAAMAFDNESYGEFAKSVLDFLELNMLKSDYTLYHLYIDGESAVHGMIDDYVFYMLALLEYYDYSKDKSYLDKAEKVCKVFIERFADENGGFFFTSNTSEKLIARKKEIYDGAMPSGNSVMIEVLSRLYSYTYNIDYYNQAEKSVRAFASAINNVPSAYTFFITGLERFLNGTLDLVFIPGNDEYGVRQLMSDIRSKFNPLVNIRIINNDHSLKSLPEYMQDMLALDGLPTAYVCSGESCSEPISGIENIKKTLSETHGVKS